MGIGTYSEIDLNLNILLTSICNAGCHWCIANEYMAAINSLDFMPDDNVAFILGLLDIEPVKQVNLLGGEPSLHPKALEIGKRIFKSGNQVGFSTNGLWKKEFGRIFENIDFPIEVEVTFLGSEAYSINNWYLLNDTFKLLKRHSTSLGLIIESPNQNFDDHLSIAEKYGFDLRWTFMEPTKRGGLTYAYYSQEHTKALGKVIVKLIKEANSRGISTWADLAIPRCAINDEDLWLFIDENNDVQFKCPPFFDISPNLEIWRCLPLAPIKTPKLTEFNSFLEAYRSVNSVKNNFLNIGVFNECLGCKYFKNICSGGPAIAKQIDDNKWI